jgi:hypothetical protein
MVMTGILIPNNAANLTSDELKLQQASLTEKRDMLIMEAISRSVGHTDWQYDQIQHLMEHREFPDGSSVFAFRKKDMLLFEPPMILDGKITQPVQYLYDKTDFKYLTFEERMDLGYYGEGMDPEAKDEDGLTEMAKVRAGILDEDEDAGDES